MVVGLRRFAPLLLLVLLGCPPEADTAAPSAERPPVPVSVATAGEPRLDRSFPVLGEVRTRHRAELAVGVDGPIVVLDALEGARVAKGALLVQVDDAPARAELQASVAAVDEAQVALTLAEADLARYQQVDLGVLAPTEVERAASQVASLAARLRSAEARVAQVRANIARHAIRAPFAGAITRRHADPGDWVTPGRVLVELASIEDLDVLVDVGAELAALVQADDAVTLHRGATQIPGIVAAVVPVLDRSTRTARVRVTPGASDVPLVPGAPITVVFETTAALTSGAQVPRDALSPTAGGARVVRLKGNEAEPVDVRILAESTDAALVDGIQPGDVVVTRGNERLTPGQSVRIVGDGG